MECKDFMPPMDMMTIEGPLLGGMGDVKDCELCDVIEEAAQPNVEQRLVVSFDGKLIG